MSLVKTDTELSMGSERVSFLAILDPLQWSILCSALQSDPLCIVGQTGKASPLSEAIKPLPCEVDCLQRSIVSMNGSLQLLK